MFINSERFRRISREGLWIFFGQLMAVCGSLIGIRILTELLTPVAYGELALGLTIAAIVNQIILGPLGGGIIRFYSPSIEQRDFWGYWNAVRKMVFLATGIILILVVISAAGLAFAGQVQWITLTISAFVFAVLNGYCANLSGVQMAARQRSIVAIHQGMDPLLRSLIAAGLLLWLGMTSTVAMIGYAVAALLLLGSQLYFFRRIIVNVNVKKISNTKRDWQNEIWNFSWPIGVFGIFTWMQLASDRWSLQLFSTTQEVGKYVVLYQLGYYPISLIAGMVMQFLLPILYQRAGDATNSLRKRDATKLSWQLVWATLGMTMVMVLTALLLHKWIFQVLVAQEYRSASYLLPWMILAGGVFASGQALASSLQAQLKTRDMMTAKIITALFGVALNIVGAFWYGMMGIVCAWLIFSMVYFLWMVALVYDGRIKKHGIPASL
ncbi:MAG: oligosaccharide flippase family protein [Smithellaceae bacterium]